MKSVFVVALLFLGIAAQAGEFGDYACEFIRFPGDTDWSLFAGSVNSSSKFLGFNSQTQEDQFFTTYVGGGQLGVCAETATSGDEPSLYIHFTTGKNMDFAGPGCGFQGEEIKTKSLAQPITAVDQFMSAEYEFGTEAGNYGELVYVGVTAQPVPVESVRDLCTKIFKQSMGRVPAPSHIQAASGVTVVRKLSLGDRHR